MKVFNRNKKKNKQKSKTNNKRFKYNNFRINRYQQMTRPSTYGPGSYRFCVTKLISGSLESQVFFLGYLDILKDNPELERVSKDFKYFKLLNISVTFYPRNYPVESNQTPCYFLVNYDGYTTPNLRLQDNVKVIPPFLTRNKMFKYKIPSIHGTTMLLNAWCTISDFGNFDEILLQFHAPGNSTGWYIRVDFNIICRGPTSEVTSKEIKIENIKENNKGEKLKINEGDDTNIVFEGEQF